MRIIFVICGKNVKFKRSFNKSKISKILIRNAWQHCIFYVYIYASILWSIKRFLISQTAVNKLITLEKPKNIQYSFIFFPTRRLNIFNVQINVCVANYDSGNWEILHQLQKPTNKDLSAHPSETCKQQVR